jgi:hypothetical protein
LSRCISGLRNKRMEKMRWGQRRKEESFEGGQGPEGAVAPDMDEWIDGIEARR